MLSKFSKEFVPRNGVLSISLLRLDGRLQWLPNLAKETGRGPWWLSLLPRNPDGGGHEKRGSFRIHCLREIRHGEAKVFQMNESKVFKPINVIN